MYNYQEFWVVSMKQVIVFGFCLLLCGCSKDVRSSFGLKGDYNPSAIERFEGERAPKPFNPFRPQPKPAQTPYFASAEEQESYFMPSMLTGNSNEQLEQALTMARNNSPMARDAMEYLADQGNSGAMYNLGVMYLKGQGGKANASKGVSYLRRAADSGHITAASTMGAMYLQGKGVNRNPAQAKKYFLKAAQKGDAQSMMYLSLMYARGDGVSKSNVEAYRWLLTIPSKSINDNIRNNQENFAKSLTQTQINQAKSGAQSFRSKYGIT